MRSVGLRVLVFEIVAFLVIANAPAARAQVAGATIAGVVKDQAGAGVPGATITVTDVGTNRQRVVISSREGIYAAAGLTPGVYQVDVELAVPFAAPIENVSNFSVTKQSHSHHRPSIFTTSLHFFRDDRTGDLLVRTEVEAMQFRLLPDPTFHA